MKILISKVIDFPKGDKEGNIARELYKTNEHVLQFVSLLKRGILFPPIVLNKNNYLSDGMHRLTAYKLLGKRKIEFIYE